MKRILLGLFASLTWLGSAEAVTWTKCAVEGRTCSFQGTRQVRYGLNGKYAFKTATKSIACNNRTFGDPAPGLNKRCHYSSVILPTPAPTPSPAPAPTPSPTPAPAPAPAPAPTPTPPPPSAGDLPTDHIFAPTSFWYTAIPTNVALHPNSASFVNSFLQQKSKYYGTVNVNTYDYASPVFIADASSPKQDVGFYDCQGKGYFDPSLKAQWQQVPIPSRAVPAEGTDAEMTIYSPSTDTIYEFWQARKNGTTFTACWGGRLQNVSKSNGIFGAYGTTATGLPFIGGQVTAEELERGEIRHAIGIALVDMAAWNVFSWPASRSDGNGAGIIPEGIRFRLDPSVNVDTLPMSRAGKIIAKAAQKYGFVVWDKAGSISIRAQNPISYEALGKQDPYHGAKGLFEGKDDYQVLSGFPWERLQFLPMNYGRP